MGVLYSILPLDETVGMYLRDLGFAISETGVSSRNPTPQELRAVSAELTDLKVDVSLEHSQEIRFEGSHDPQHEQWTVLRVTNFSGDETTPHSIYFAKGWPSLVLRIVHAITAHCGPLVIFPDSGELPIVVQSADDIDDLLAAWDLTR